MTSIAHRRHTTTHRRSDGRRASTLALGGGLAALVLICAMPQAFAADVTGPGTSGGACNQANTAIACGAFSSANTQRGTAYGVSSGANNEEATALGYSSNASVFGAVAVGAWSEATANLGVAIGAYSLANRANAVSVGSDGTGTNGNSAFTRQIINVSDGTEATDAVNKRQLDAVASSLGNAVAAVQNGQTAQGQRITTLEDGQMAQGKSIAALQDGQTAQGQRLTTLEDGQTAQGKSISALQDGQTAQGKSISALLDAQTVQGQSLASLQNRMAQSETNLAALDQRVAANTQQIAQVSRAAKGGIAAAMALGGAVMPPNARVALSLNLATYGGEQGYAFAASVRASSRFYLSAGFAGSDAASSGGRVGLTMAW